MRFRYQKRKHAGRYFITLRKSIVIMEVKIKYKDLIDRCEELSAFEANGRVDANGESRYLELHINEVDRKLVSEYIKQAVHSTVESISRMVENIEDTVDKEEEIEEIPDTTEAYPFEMIIPDSSEYLQYHEVNEGPTSPANGTDFAFMDYYGKFGIVEWKDKSRWNYVFYPNANVVGNNYIYEEGVKKVYKDLSTGKEYTWRGEGVLVEYERKPSYITRPSSSEGVIITIRQGTRWNGIKTFTKHINEAIISYAMAAWLRGKLDDRASFYEGLFNTTLAAAVKNVFTKQVPV